MLDVLHTGPELWEILDQIIPALLVHRCLAHNGRWCPFIQKCVFHVNRHRMS